MKIPCPSKILSSLVANASNFYTKNVNKVNKDIVTDFFQMVYSKAAEDIIPIEALKDNDIIFREMSTFITSHSGFSQDMFKGKTRSEILEIFKENATDDTWKVMRKKVEHMMKGLALYGLTINQTKDLIKANKGVRGEEVRAIAYREIAREAGQELPSKLLLAHKDLYGNVLRFFFKVPSLRKGFSRSESLVKASEQHVNNYVKVVKDVSDKMSSDYDFLKEDFLRQAIKYYDPTFERTPRNAIDEYYSAILSGNPTLRTKHFEAFKEKRLKPGDLSEENFIKKSMLTTLGKFKDKLDILNYGTTFDDFKDLTTKMTNIEVEKLKSKYPKTLEANKNLTDEEYNAKYLSTAKTIAIRKYFNNADLLSNVEGSETHSVIPFIKMIFAFGDGLSKIILTPQRISAMYRRHGLSKNVPVGEALLIEGRSGFDGRIFADTEIDIIKKFSEINTFKDSNGKDMFGDTRWRISSKYYIPTVSYDENTELGIVSSYFSNSSKLYGIAPAFLESLKKRTIVKKDDEEKNFLTIEQSTAMWLTSFNTVVRKLAQRSDLMSMQDVVNKEGSLSMFDNNRTVFNILKTRVKYFVDIENKILSGAFNVTEDTAADKDLYGSFLGWSVVTLLSASGGMNTAYGVIPSSISEGGLSPYVKGIMGYHRAASAPPGSYTRETHDLIKNYQVTNMSGSKLDAVYLDEEAPTSIKRKKTSNQTKSQIAALFNGFSSSLVNKVNGNIPAKLFGISELVLGGALIYGGSEVSGGVAMLGGTIRTFEVLKKHIIDDNLAFSVTENFITKNVMNPALFEATLAAVKQRAELLDRKLKPNEIKEVVEKVLENTSGDAVYRTHLGIGSYDIKNVLAYLLQNATNTKEVQVGVAMSALYVFKNVAYFMQEVSHNMFLQSQTIAGLNKIVAGGTRSFSDGTFPELGPAVLRDIKEIVKKPLGLSPNQDSIISIMMLGGFSLLSALAGVGLILDDDEKNEDGSPKEADLLEKALKNPSTVTFNLSLASDELTVMLLTAQATKRDLTKDESDLLKRATAGMIGNIGGVFYSGILADGVKSFLGTETQTAIDRVMQVDDHFEGLINAGNTYAYSKNLNKLSRVLSGTPAFPLSATNDPLKTILNASKNFRTAYDIIHDNAPVSAGEYNVRTYSLNFFGFGGFDKMGTEYENSYIYFLKERIQALVYKNEKLTDEQRRSFNDRFQNGFIKHGGKMYRNRQYAQKMLAEGKSSKSIAYFVASKMKEGEF